ncbi:Tubulin_tyrosine ligase-like 4 [Hexamita inflata]|uniref:Tubulin--tyrosine ligase-like protein 5 n=1 Tax=Hexamita inflata TaxID=28002 RepID=A0AA86NX41_9EUKA|nr:Tubulin tyrosine ligase-like 4 [Hexamita inflata]
MKSVYFDSLATEYVKDIFAARGYTQLPLKEAQLLWTMSKDASFFTKLNQTQISNQLPGIMQMDRKDYLFQSLNQYTLQNNISPFYPKTFILNSEKNQFVEDDSFYIYKPAVNSRETEQSFQKRFQKKRKTECFKSSQRIQFCTQIKNLF